MFVWQIMLIINQIRTEDNTINTFLPPTRTSLALVHTRSLSSTHGPYAPMNDAKHLNPHKVDSHLLWHRRTCQHAKVRESLRVRYTRIQIHKHKKTWDAQKVKWWVGGVSKTLASHSVLVSKQLKKEEKQRKQKSFSLMCSCIKLAVKANILREPLICALALS